MSDAPQGKAHREDLSSSGRDARAAPRPPAGSPPPGSSAHDAPASARLDELLAVAIDVAEAAGKLLLERYQAARGDSVWRAQEVESKSTPTDLVSEADLAAESLIVSRLAELRPEDGVLGEEGAVKQSKSGLRWVVDPLDGTINFLFGIPQWCVSVAVEDDDGVTLAGAIYDPCKRQLWSATRDGEPALDGAAIRRAQRGDLATALVATGFAYDAQVRAAQARVLCALAPQVRDIRRFGSAALDLAWTAAGRYDAYFERTVKPWDIAAGVLICERAGVAVRGLPEADGLPAGILAATPGLVEPLFAIVGEAPLQGS